MHITFEWRLQEALIKLVEALTKYIEENTLTK